jgi:hypothetical protein
MRWVWALLAAVVLAGAAAMLWPERGESTRVVEPTVERGAQPQAPVAPSAPARAATPIARPAAPAAAPAPTGEPRPPARIERLPDGTVRLDGRFVTTGSGSEQDPIVLSWPLVFSASETIDAAAGKLAAPPHIDFLNGQWVQISGYLAPPLWGEQTSELLVMKNRWDGCCIGLPPTPFDCIETSLAAPIQLGAQHSISFGTVRGRLVVEPFKAGAFLLGLYRLESAQIEEMKSR